MNLYKALRLLFSSKKEWKLPNKSHTLIYDGNGSEVLRQYVSIKDSVIFHTRGELVNIPALLMSGFRVKFYIDAYIRISKPKFVITYTDNHVPFYLLKKRHPNIVFIAVQNGVRSRRGDVFSTIQNYNGGLAADYILTFNQSIGREYLKYISGKIEPIGSLKNNSHLVKNKPISKDVLFISQYTLPPNKDQDSHFQFINGVSVSWRRVYEAEKKLLKLLAPYCHKHKLRLSIVGRLSQSGSEHEFYKECILDCDNWEFLPKCDEVSSYDLVDQSQYIVGIDSTLLYEAYSRGKRTAFFPWRSEILGEASCQFAWPSNLEDAGFFWSNRVDQGDFDRVMNYIINASPDEWSGVHSQYCQSIMNYDPQNVKTISLFRELGLPMNTKY